MKPLLLDLFCGAGGCARGFQRAGFHVVGVDNRPQPRYAGDAFHRADALAVLAFLVAGNEWCGYVLADFAAAHASPPCKRFTVASRVHGKADTHPDLLTPTRELLRATGLPYSIENVPGAPLRDPIQCCGSAVGLRVYGDGGAWTRKAPGGGGVKVVGVEAAAALGIDWTDYQPELAQAIPPAYTEHVGGYLMAAVSASQG